MQNARFMVLLGYRLSIIDWNDLAIILTHFVCVFACLIDNWEEVELVARFSLCK